MIPISRIPGRVAYTGTYLPENFSEPQRKNVFPASKLLLYILGRAGGKSPDKLHAVVYVILI